jgi:hypothetical protein
MHTVCPGLATVVVIASFAAAPGRAQAPSASAPGQAFEIISTDRWLHARQPAAFTPWNPADIRHWLHVDSIFPGPNGATRELRISQNVPASEVHLRLVHDSLGQVRSVVPFRPTPASGPLQEYLAVADRVTGRIANLDRPAGFGTFEVDAMELIPSFHPPHLQAGAQWTDTVRLENIRGQSRFSLRGVRHSRLVRDTAIDGVTHWLVRDSAEVELVDRWPEVERSLDTVVAKERTAAGRISGSYLYDPTSGFFAVKSDTTRLSGETALIYPDGRAFGVPARYERERTWRRYGPAAAAARREETLSAMSSRRTGMLILPRDTLEERMRRGDLALLDSVIGEWHRSRDPAERMRLRELIGFAPRPPGDDLQDRLDRLALEAGDTISVLPTVLSRTNPQRPLRVQDLELVLPLLRDPAVALGYGVDPASFYGNFAEAMLRYPPAIAGDLPGVSCTAEACRLLAAQVDAPGDSRLRDLGLIAAFAMDPVRWEAALRERAADGSVLLRPAMELLAGVGATWPVAARLPLPGANASWRQWLDWMGAQHPDLPPPPPNMPSPNPLRFAQSHFVAIRFFEARTGESLTGAIRRRYLEAASDSARMVFGAMLLGVGEPLSTADQLADALATASDADRALALRQLPGLLRTAPRADEALTTEILGRILSVAIEGEQPWPQLPGTGDPARPRAARRITAGGPILILSDDLTAAVRERWGSQAELITRAEWEARPPRRAAVLFTPGPVARLGPFVRASINYQTREERREDESPAGFAGGFSVILMSTVEGWVVVDESFWIT